MKFLSTSSYHKSLNKLSHNYKTVKPDIANEFKNLTFAEIFTKQYVLKDSGVAKILKVRIANSEQNKGKSSGFRILLIVDSRTSEITFLNIFAKTVRMERTILIKMNSKNTFRFIKLKKNCIA